MIETRKEEGGQFSPNNKDLSMSEPPPDFALYEWQRLNQNYNWHSVTVRAGLVLQEMSQLNCGHLVLSDHT